MTRALIVEDEPAWQDILSEIMSDMGLDVDIAGDYDSATTILRASAHRVAVVDLNLQGGPSHDQDGLRVLGAVRQLDPACTPLLLTGFATVELAVRALTEYGAYTCLRKEAFRRAEFRGVVQQILALAPTTPGAGQPETPQAAIRSSGPIGGRRLDAPMLSVLVVEDDAGWRSILTELIADAGFRARVCTSYGEALGYLRREAHRAAVVDLSLSSSVWPGGNRDGYHVLAEARRKGIATIVVSGMGTPAEADRAYEEFGTFAYVEKQGFDRADFRRLLVEAAGFAGDATVGVASLTPRERDVLAMAASGLTNKGIARSLAISENTVKRYLKAVFAKLNVGSRAAATAKAVSAGLGPGRSGGTPQP